MTRESRANVIFIAVLVPLLIPGFYILMKKRLDDPNPSPNHLPHPAPHQIAYIQPLPVPPLPRKQPEQAREWVTKLVEERLDAAALERRRTTYSNTPLVSDRFVTELVGDFTVDHRPRIVLLRWETTPLSASKDVTVTRGGVAYDRVKTEQIDVPTSVRHALQNVGYVDPPLYVWWIAADGPAEPARTIDNDIVLTTPGKDGKPVTELLSFGLNKSPATRPATEVLP